MAAAFIFEIKGAKKENNFNFLKGGFSVMRGPMDMIFGVFSETYVRLLPSTTSQFFSRYSKSCNNLNVKKFLKNSTALNKKMSRVGAVKLYVSDTTL